jgi:prepilin-type N-terminal cleavage/methylation domain-containing protein
MKKKKLKGFSILETLVTLAIFGIMTAMLSQAILININITRKASVRSRIREEMSQISSLIERDVRNAQLVGTCGLVPPNENKCTITSVSSFTWTDNCPSLGGGIKSICRKDLAGNILYQSSKVLSITTLKFQVITPAGITDPTKSTILVTIIGAAVNPNLNINNQVRQLAVSTRNFTI